MSDSDPGLLRRCRGTITASVMISFLLGGVVFGFHWMDSIIKGGWTQDLLHAALIHSFNTTAVAFWIVLIVLLVLVWPFQENVSPAARDWERRLRLAEELFDREAAARGRKRWWR